MLIRLVQLTATLTITILLTIGMLSLYGVINPELNNRLLGACCLQLIFPFAFSVLGFFSKGSWQLVFAGSVLLFSAVSNHVDPKNGFVDAVAVRGTFKFRFLPSLVSH